METWEFCVNFVFYLDLVFVLLTRIIKSHFLSIYTGRVCYGPTLLYAKSIWLTISCSILFSTPINYYTMSFVSCHCQSPFFIHGPSLLWAKFVLGRVVQNPLKCRIKLFFR